MQPCIDDGAKYAMLFLMTNLVEPIIVSACTQPLIRHINRKSWWHVQPLDPNAYYKRGKFYSSSFEEAEFYGRPGDPERVTVARPLAGDEAYIETTLFGKCPSDDLLNLYSGKALVTARFALDARIKKAAVKAGYDSIALMTPRAWSRFQEVEQLPRSIELNVFA